MADILNLLNEQGANVTVSVSLDDLRTMAYMIAEEVMMKMRMQTDDILLSANEVCQMLGVTKQTLWRWDKMGYLSKVKVGNVNRYRRTEVLTIKNNK